jgi:type IV pilus assembly protein PilC
MTGELTEVLDDQSAYYDQTEKIRKQMISAMIYPTIVFIASIGVATFIMLYVIPQFVEIYESMDASAIPKFTLAVLALSNFLKKYIVYILIAIVIIAILLVWAYKSVRAFRTICQWIVMKLPIIGNTVIYNEVAMFTKTFSSLLAHNVFITDSMEVLKNITNNEIYKMIIFDTITNLAKGDKISEAFKDNWAFPLPAYEMLVTGEKTGELPEMMAKVSDYYQTLHAESVARIKTVTEPMITIFLTVIVGVLIMAIIIPMFSMYSTVQGL